MQRLWAPWRMAYIDNVDAEKKEGCFFCNAWKEKGGEKENLLIARSTTCLIMLNRFPYTNAHLMVAPARHAGTMEEVTAGEGAELWRLATICKKALANAISPHGFNIGINQGRVAGAGVLDHLHIHVVPRWNGDINFMPVLADARVIPQALEETREQILPYFEELM